MMIVFFHMACTFLGLHSRLIMPRHQVSDSPQLGINKMSLYTHFQNQGSASGGVQWYGWMSQSLPWARQGSRASQMEAAPPNAWAVPTEALRTPSFLVKPVWSMESTVNMRNVNYCGLPFFPLDISKLTCSFVKGSSMGIGVTFSMTQSSSRAKRWWSCFWIRRDHLLFKVRCDVEVADL